MGAGPRILAFIPLVEEFSPYIKIDAVCNQLETKVSVLYPDGFVWKYVWDAELPIHFVINDVRKVCLEAMSTPEPWIEALLDKFRACEFNDEDPEDVYCRTHEDGVRVRLTLCNSMYGKIEAGRVAVEAERLIKRYK